MRQYPMVCRLLVIQAVELLFCSELLFFKFGVMLRTSDVVQIAGDYMPPAPITAPVMSLATEAAVPQDRVQVPPGAPQEPNLQVRETW